MTAALRIVSYLLALTILCCPASVFSQTQSAQVEKVIDGDSVVLRDGRQVRYIGIDAPEMTDGITGRPQPLAEAARRCNEDLVLHRRVLLVFDRQRTDRYDRLLAYVYGADGTFINGEMVTRGLAFVWFRVPNIRMFQPLLEMQRRAMSSAKGIWGGVDLRSEVRGYWTGNAASRVLHRSDCRWARRIRPGNRVVFHRLWDAFWEGYAPSRRCRPVTWKP